jgi:hypothetical protein
MNVIKIDNLNDIISTHPQFKKRSIAYDAVSMTLGCTLSDAKENVAFHCNMLSLYSCIRADERYHGSYYNFFKFAYENKFCNERGYIGAIPGNDKPDLLKNLNVISPLTKYTDFEDIINPFRLNPDKFYQMKIKADTSGFHYMACYINDDKFYISDTSYRGIGVESLKYVNQKNFQWIKEV